MNPQDPAYSFLTQWLIYVMLCAALYACPSSNSRSSESQVSQEFTRENVLDASVHSREPPTEMLPSLDKNVLDASRHDSTTRKNDSGLRDSVSERSTEQKQRSSVCTHSSSEAVGHSSWGHRRYIHTLSGRLPIVMSAPHGGSWKPSELPNRTYGVVLMDSYSRETMWEVAHNIYKMTGRMPHLVTNHLHRIKLDANRAIKEAAQGQKGAEQAWKDYHQYIEAAKAWIVQHCERGHYFDFHTHAHTVGWTEFGVLLGRTQLKRKDAELSSPEILKMTSLRALSIGSTTPLAELIRGPYSLGSMLMQKGFKAIPSVRHPDPGSHSFFKGGYNTARHGSRDGGVIDATQIETYTRFSREQRSAYSAVLAQSIVAFMERFYGFKLRASSVRTPTNSQCTKASMHSWDAQGQIQIADSTLGAKDEFSGMIRCGKSFATSGPQVYHRFEVKNPTRIRLTVHSDFAARIVLFGSTCRASEIDRQCKTMGLPASLVRYQEPFVREIKLSRAGVYTVAIDSRNASWYGTFSLHIQKIP